LKAAWIVGLCLAVGVCGLARAAEQTWEIRGEFSGLKSGSADVAVIRLPDGSRLEVPLGALSDASRSAVEKRVTAKPKPDDGTAATKPADGKQPKTVVADALKAVEADAAACRTAADAVVVYRLCLAGDTLEAGDRAAAEERLSYWRGLAAAGKVRLGNAWVARDAAEKAAAEAESIMSHAFELVRLGNFQLAWEEFEKAERADPESGRAPFVMGLFQAINSQDESKVMDSFAEAVRREPDNPAALNNLAVCEVRNRRQSNAVTHFRQALERMPDAQPVVDNVGFTIRTAGALRPKMSEKVIAEFNELYKSFPREWKSNPTPASSYALLAPRCRQFTAGLQATEIEDVAAALAAGFGFFVAPGRILVSSKLVAGAKEITVRDPANRLSMQPATVLATQESPAIALLKCEAIQGTALPLAKALPDVGTAVTAVGRAVGAPLALGPTLVRSTEQTAADKELDGGNVILSAAVARGVGGGPVIDESGLVVGMVGATPRTEASGTKRGVCIPIERIRPFLEKHLPDARFADQSGGDDGQQAVAGTVIVTVAKKPASATR
jgi:S1-C subfamily serine protease